MKIAEFGATADLVGRRIRLRWTFLPEAGQTVADPPEVTVRRKRRDFAFAPLAPGATGVLYDSTLFPPPPEPGVLAVVDLPDRDLVDGPLRIRERTVTVAELAGGQPREVLRRTVRTVLGADRTVLRQEVELLDVGGIGGQLDAGVPYYYQLDSPTLPAGPERERLRATATAGEVYGHNRMLYEQIPEVYRRHDTIGRTPDAATGLLPEASATGGQLRRFVDPFGAALDSLRSSAEGLRRLRDTAEVDARFLPLLAQWIGWDLTADEEIARQRLELRTAPRLYGAVGTLPGLRSLVDHYTGWSTQVAEFAQHVARANAAPQRNIFASVLSTNSWQGVDDAVTALGFAAPNNLATGAVGVAAQLTGAQTEPFALHDGICLTVAVDGGLPVTVTFGAADFADPAAATAAEVAEVVDAALDELRAEAAGGALRLRSLLPAASSRIEVMASPASLVSLEGAAQGRLATAVDAAGRLWVAHGSTVGAGGGEPRLHVKTHLRGRWYDTQPVEARPVAAQADPALVALADGRLWLSWVEHPGTPQARLRWRLGAAGPLTPARLRGDVTAPFRLTAGTRLALTGYGTTETFTVPATNPAATAEQVAAALNGGLAGVAASVAADGSLALRTTATGPGVALRVDLAASTAAWALGFGDRHLNGQGGWEPTVDWGPAAETPLPAGRHADGTALLDPGGAIRLFWSTHVGGAWQLARLRWDDRLLVATSAGVGVRTGDGPWSALTTANGLPSNDVRGVAVDADGSSWFATAAGGAVFRPDGTVAVLTTATTGGGLASNDVRAVGVAPDGTAWFAHPAGVSARDATGAWQTVTAGPDGLPSNDTRHVLATLDGTVWVATAAGLTRRVPGGTWQAVAETAGARQVAQGPDGTVWVATGSGLARVGADGTAAMVDLVAAGAGPGTNDTRAVAPALAGTGPVWVATAAGLVELSSAMTARRHGTGDGLPSDDCRAVLAQPDGTVWVGTPAGLAVRGPDPAATWRVVSTVDGLVGNAVRALHGPWSAPLRFAATGSGARDPHAVRDGNRLWLTWAERQATADEADPWLIRLRSLTWPAASWSAPVAVTTTAAGGRNTDREPALAPLTGGAVQVFLRSNRGGGPRLWSVLVNASGTPGAPVTVHTGPTADTNPAPVRMPGGAQWLLFRSDRNVALGRLGGGVPGAADAATSRRAPEEAAVRRHAGSISAVLADLDRNRGHRQFGDLLDYTPQRPDGGPLAPDELYTPATIGLYVQRGPAGRPLVRRDADRLRQLLDRFLPVNVRAVIVLRSAALEEAVFPPGHELTDAFRDDYPFVEIYQGPSEQIAVTLRDWLVYLATDGTSVTADPTQLSTLRRRTWWPPFQ
ncbi:phage tail protein [Phytohabitans rumicis]|uniref:Uncharacterized protein n=1 Tax=Phytohabitans rumicis TaxID=1076125 RepID=A0A6V8LDB0_9ACTN|nr:phage tail protein [Phytohabitans rumicis]GFJ95213.1 hypothetical protein Prum_088550 [Phytohabitans rumicis]